MSRNWSEWCCFRRHSEIDWTRSKTSGESARLYHHHPREREVYLLDQESKEEFWLCHPLMRNRCSIGKAGWREALFMRCKKVRWTGTTESDSRRHGGWSAWFSHSTRRKHTQGLKRRSLNGVIVYCGNYHMPNKHPAGSGVRRWSWTT